MFISMWIQGHCVFYSSVQSPVGAAGIRDGHLHRNAVNTEGKQSVGGAKALKLGSVLIPATLHYKSTSFSEAF